MNLGLGNRILHLMIELGGELVSKESYLDGAKDVC